MSVKASKDKDSILADVKELLKILIPAIQTMPKIERHDGAAQDMKRAAFDMIHHFTIAYNCQDVRELNIQQMFGDYGRAIERIKESNKIKDKERYVDNFVASVNSYTGMLKNRTDYRRMASLIKIIDAEWWRYVYWNASRQYVAVYEKYKEAERLNRKYKLNLKKKKNYEKSKFQENRD